MSTAHESQQAAGTAATAVRSEVKTEWYKKPLFLHLMMASAVIIVALLINANFNVNFFWKLLLGGGLMWGGMKLATSFDSVAPAKVWGNILRGLGAVIIILAVIKSGVGLVAEKTVNIIDSKLTEVATGKPSGSSAGETVELAERDKVPHKANFLGMPVGHEITVKAFRPNQEIIVLVDTAYQHIMDKQFPDIQGVKAYSVCARVVRPKLPEDVTVKFRTDRGDETNAPVFVMAEESRVMLVKHGYDGMSFDVKLKLTVKKVGTDNCVNTGE